MQTKTSSLFRARTHVQAGEASWWKSFAGCTSAKQCLDLAFSKHK
jgi:hypothetical protein